MLQRRMEDEVWKDRDFSFLLTLWSLSSLFMCSAIKLTPSIASCTSGENFVPVLNLKSR